MSTPRRWLFLIPLVAAACGGSGDSSPSTTSPATTSPTTIPTTPTNVLPTTATSSTSSTVTSAPTTSVAVNPPTTQRSSTTTAPTTAETTAERLVDTKIYLLGGERLEIVHRRVASPEVLRGAISALFAGPSSGDADTGLRSAVPGGTRLVDIALSDGLATIDVSEEFASGGGTSSMQARLAQVVFTATQFPNVDRVNFRIDGKQLDILGGEGLLLTEPQTRAMMNREITGSVIFDTPRPGAVVRSPFEVTGEGDVYEAQFPLEVWAGGEMISFVGPVWAGAWGTWGPIKVTVTVDAPPGPIELIGYDPGGCGTDPECPPIIRTVVPLILAD